ncbi:MAG TPA: Asp-tRNA(Asn)/Glu-tRNA(Gln) amidotransferase subunit GatC [Gelria sp.]|jgi:aspartyl-tRNA(Asn)/glutamyl-tRNA(Gln) amidotransferase subunit C|nr:Asp-tRNA(Asn)/Glu-tRNA(Gln) amidotransferase subunit GatC [Gelria sp.]
MALTIKEVEDIAFAARLNLTEEEKKDFVQQLSLILDYTNCLNELDTDNIEPLIYILPVYNVFRDDVICPSSPRDGIMSGGPLLEDGQYKVPKII